MRRVYQALIRKYSLTGYTLSDENQFVEELKGALAVIPWFYRIPLVIYLGVLNVLLPFRGGNFSFPFLPGFQSVSKLLRTLFYLSYFDYAKPLSHTNA